MKIDLIVINIDSIVIRIDSICATFNSIVSTTDLVKKPDSNAKLPTWLCATFHSIFTDSTLFELILQQSSQVANANRSHLRHLTTLTGHVQ